MNQHVENIKNYQGRHSWDPLTILFAVRGFENYCIANHGKNEILNFGEQQSNDSTNTRGLLNDIHDDDDSEIKIYGFNRWIKSDSSQDFYLSWKNEDCKEKAWKEINNLILGNNAYQATKHGNKL